MNGQVKFKVYVNGGAKVQVQGNVIVNGQVEVNARVQAKGNVWIAS